MLTLKLWLRRSVLISTDRNANVIGWVVRLPAKDQATCEWRLYPLGLGHVDETFSRYWRRLSGDGIWLARLVCSRHCALRTRCTAKMRGAGEICSIPKDISSTTSELMRASWLFVINAAQSTFAIRRPYEAGLLADRISQDRARGLQVAGLELRRRTYGYCSRFP